jgi:peptidoglycan pentaglycine glycine transferase (the first glycine)
LYNEGMSELQKINDKETWDDFVLDNGGHPLQLWGWGQVKTAHGWQADRLVLASEQGDYIAGAQVLTRRLPYPFKAFSYIPRGSVGDSGETNQLLDEAARFVSEEYGSVALSIEPATTEFEKPEGWRRGVNSVLPAETILLDLSLSESQLLTNMAKKTRQYIRKSAAEQGVIKQVKTTEQVKEVLEIYHQTAQRAGFNIHDDQYYYDVFTSMADHGIIFATYEGDQPIAFLWIALSESIAFELYGGVTERGQELRANYALKWHAILKMKEWGITSYDFGGLINGGVTTFKQSWAIEETVLAGTFDKPLSPLYNLWTKGLPTAKKLVRRLRGKR